MILLKWVFNTFTLILLILTLIDLSWQQQDEFLDSTAKHLFWFVQVTDLHISHYGHETRLSDFKQFINEIIIKLIKPAVVIASGDLVHNLDRTFDSRQYESEWIRYQQVLLETNVTQHTKWLDIRGNHDVFMDAEPESSKSFYRQYSQQGRLHSSSYQYTLKTSDGDQYSFVGIDMCPKPAPGIAMNFFGHLTKSEMRHLEQLTKEIHHSNVTIYFGHYPLSFTYSSKVQEKIMRNGLVYLNGHLHAGIPHLYAHHSSGLLELELADWKQHRRFRLVTIDSGLLAFRDFQFNNQKLIYAVITHPKESRFRTVREPLARLKQRTHIRILIFSHHPILTVHVTIDSDFIGNAVQSVDNLQLFVLKWNPTKYDDDKDHKMIVQIKVGY
ncbi:unnamed protein product [Didymodactylos carnosus]|uniref:Calcineurin-like phosphoesterase domain-containing protein n=1 Tax=Didymodactylos carnosus TaxID=1234261 RepID=A0A8S2CQH1_9BILA|nr:unnamed protein product [Didymodactylos carnosus]CAF3559086.1 unnamed protein product [Didymodactylos carnosus]